MSNQMEVELQSDSSENEENRKYLIMDVFNSVILDKVHSSDVMMYLPMLRDKFNELRKLDKEGRYKESMTRMLKYIDELEMPGKWKMFVDALKEAEYDAVFNCIELLEDLPPHQHDEDYQLINIFMSEIIKDVRLENSNLLTILFQKNVISENNFQCITHQRSNQEAMLELFTHLHRKSRNWYTVFLEALLSDDKTELVQQIDPKFLAKRKTIFNFESMDYEEDVLTGGGEAYDAGVESGNFVENKSFMNSFSPQTSKLERMHSTMRDNNLASCPIGKSFEKTAEVKEMNISVAEPEEKLPRLNEKEDDVDCKKLELRNYQKVLCERALKGDNVIICAPTGSGKTIVAAKIIKEHMKTRGIHKVAFLVNQVALAEQQYKVFKEYINQRIEIVTGDTQNTDKIPISKLIPNTDVIVMTAQILVDAIADGEIKDVTSFSLIIFDECHHTKSRHPYNQLMNRYIDVKLEDISKDEPNNSIAAEYRKAPNLPQIVGLTASLGVGKASKIEGAMDHIISLCANLDIKKICTPDGYEGEMDAYVNVPQTTFERCSGRKNDIFHKTVAEIMNDIEKEMKESPFLESDEDEIKKFRSTHLNPPAKKGNEAYTQWVYVLKREIARFDDKNARKFFVTCQKMLQIFNSALIINKDCRSTDSLSYIEEEMSENITPNQSKDVREKLIAIYKSRHIKLQQASKYNINPKLEKLKEMIIRGFEKDPDSRAIVFAKTLSLVQKLKKWMEETPELKRLNLNPETVTGARSSADKGGMTKTQQMEVLECFKEGSGKIIIATSVAEEGLDIQKCNLVIRYDHVTNEIAMVQSRGRARAANSQFLVVSGDDSNSAKKEQMNLSRELMMKQAIKRLEEIESKIFNDKVIERQKNAKLYRDAEKKRRDGRIIRDSEFELRCFQCNTLACFSSDIRTIKQCQYTVIEDGFKETYFTRPHPEPTQIGSGNEFMKTNKIFCKKDNCGYDWGIEAIFRNMSFPLIKIQSFVIEDADGKKTTVKKWKNVPFPIHEISDDDLRQRFDAASGNNMESDSEDDTN